jgi:hypothetical protein
MALREFIRRRPAVVVLICVIAIAAVLYSIFADRITSSRAAIPVTTEAKCWYTIDDGKTYFVESADRLSPFSYNGKSAYRCFVWTCDGGKTRFVSHLQRHKPSLWRDRQKTGRILPGDQVMDPFDVKVPQSGEEGWVDFSAPGADRIKTPRCPDGRGGKPEPVPPN